MLVVTRKDGDALDLICPCGCTSRVIVRGATVKLAVAVPADVEVRRVERDQPGGRSPGQRREHQG